MNKERQIDYDKAYMKMAMATSELSYANRNKVGCIIVSPKGQIISQGFNGTPSGYTNNCEEAYCDCDHEHTCQLTSYDCINDVVNNSPCKYYKLRTLPEVLHAESNAISKCAKWASSTEDATLYVTLSPCFECAKLIIQSGISRVCYLNEYRDMSGIDFLKRNNIIVEKIEL